MRLEVSSCVSERGYCCFYPLHWNLIKRKGSREGKEEEAQICTFLYQLGIWAQKQLTLNAPSAEGDSVCLSLMLTLVDFSDAPGSSLPLNLRLLDTTSPNL